MTKKNLKPQQAAPVQREINTTSSAEVGLVLVQGFGGHPYRNPFAGDDAE